ncbi:MAG: hypothetical protein IJS53_04880 [Clostridia bacterium]|nr:hypothetical protein [Clostridia bacterium]
MKKLACLLLALTMACSLCPPVQAEGVLEDLDAFREAFFAHTDAGDKYFYLLFTNEVREALLQYAVDETVEVDHVLQNSLVMPLMLNAGVIQCCGYETVSQRSGIWTLKFQEIEWYAGKKIALAAQKGDLSGLSEREMETLRVAREFVDTLSGTEAEKELAIHDYLCGHVTGFADEDDYNEDDSAVGALLNGEANCDGYADAFYLLCSLAGVEVRYVSGIAKGGLHMWNAVRVDGQWVMVDVTWDDLGPYISHLYFNIGAERMARDHEWVPAALPPGMAE